MKGLKFLLLGLVICLATRVKAQFNDSADDIYYYVQCDNTGNPRENGWVLVFNFDGTKACELSGYLELKLEYEPAIDDNIQTHGGDDVNDVKRNIQKNMMYYEDKVENTEYKLKYVSGNKYQGTTNTISWTGPMGNYCWGKEIHLFDFTYDRKTMIDNVERTSNIGKGIVRETNKYVKVNKSFFKVGRSRTPSATMYE